MNNIRNLPQLMGIVNVTPDSFSDGGQFLNARAAIDHGLKLIKEGAAILDIGGESSRANATPITPEEEQGRILPVINGLLSQATHNTICISVDTRNASTMQAALKAGATMINDISALTHDKDALGVVASSRCSIVLMHMQGTPQTMQSNPSYANVVDDVKNYLQSRIENCLQAGIQKEKIIIDVGIGFGKTLEHNLTLLQNLSCFLEWGCPLLIGVSRKSFIGTLCNNAPPENRLAGSIAAALYAAQNGAAILRVHDVKETLQALKIWAFLR